MSSKSKRNSHDGKIIYGSMAEARAAVEEIATNHPTWGTMHEYMCVWCYPPGFHVGHVPKIRHRKKRKKR